MDSEEDYERLISDYYEGSEVTSLITLKVETKDADAIASELTANKEIEDLFLVTGDTDIVAKAHFKNYAELKDFMVKKVGAISGVRETKTLMVVTTYKERGITKAAPEGEEMLKVSKF